MTESLKNPRRFSEAAAYGLRVFPMNIADGPPPVTWTKFKQHAATPNELAAWDATELNVGVICGRPSDIVVLVVDDSVPDDMLPRFPIPATPWLQVGRERHFYLRMPTQSVGGSISIGPHRFVAFADASTVVGPGSVLPSGAVCDWVVSPADVPFAELPDYWIADLTDAKYATSGDISVLRQLSPATQENILAHLFNSCARRITELQNAAQDEHRETLERLTTELFGDVSTVAVNWFIFGELLKGAALSVGLEPVATEKLMASIADSETYRENYALAAALRWAYDEGSSSFLSRKKLSPSEFNSSCGGLENWDTANLLLSAGLIDRVYACAECGRY